MRTQHILIISQNTELGQTLRMLLPHDCDVEIFAALRSLQAPSPRAASASLALVDARLMIGKTLNDSEMVPLRSIPVALLLPDGVALTTLNPLLAQLRVLGILTPPYTTDDNRMALAAALDNAPRHGLQIEIEHQLALAQKQLDERAQRIDAVYAVSRSLAASVGLNTALAAIATKAVNLSGAEEIFIVLQEDSDLHLRISYHRNDPGTVSSQHTPAGDSVAQQVLHTGKPAMRKRETHLATGNHVQALYYLPVRGPEGKAIGVLGAVSQEHIAEFTNEQRSLLEAMADFTAVVLENAQRLNEVTRERCRLRSFLEQLTDVVLIADGNDHLIFWNHSAASAFSIPDGVEGQPLQDVVNHPQVLELLKRADTMPEPVRGEVLLADGHTLNAQITSISELGRAIVMQDISKLKELDRIKSEFVQTVSHDLRTPLTTIQGYVMLLDRAGPLTDLQQAFVRKVLISLNDITELITDLLDLGRIEAEYVMPMHSVRVEQVLENAKAQKSNRAQEANVSLEFVKPMNPLWVRGNSDSLQQALERIIDNGIKYNRPGGWVAIDTEDNDEHVIVSIRDNGFGIPLADQASIFDRFYRARLPETETLRGTGLGLAIAKSIIEHHRGRIWVESTVGQGSCFYLLLPRQKP